MKIFKHTNAFILISILSVSSLFSCNSNRKIADNCKPESNIISSPIRIITNAEDLYVPVVKTRQNITLTLTGYGTGKDGAGKDGAGKIYAWQIDNGSYDANSDVKLEVRRLSGELCNDNTAFEKDKARETKEFVKFCCDDIPEGTKYGFHKIELKVWNDRNKNGIIGDNEKINGLKDTFSTEFVEIKVQNALTTKIECPEDITVTCDMMKGINLGTYKNVLDSNLLITGSAKVYDLCTDLDLFYKDEWIKLKKSECNSGKILRTFKTSKDGIDYACKQTISVNTNDSKSYKPLENSLLWQITGPGISSVSYLYGTIHMIDSKDFYLPKGTMTAIDAAKKLVFEIDMKEMSDISSMMGMMNKIFMKDNMTLKDLVTEEEYSMISTHFQEMGLPIFMLQRMKPMFLTVFAYGDMDPNGLKNGNLKSYEMEFMEMASNSGKETGGLESIEFQIGLFDEIPYDAQAKMLVDAIKGTSGNEGSGEFEKMTQMYLDQDINAMISSISDQGSEVAGFEDKLLVGRNKNWIPLIIDGARKQSTFFAVGAGHLAGPDGVINLLRKAGMKVTPLK